VKAKGADLCILNLGADTSTATGLLMLTIMALGNAKGLPKRKPMGIPGMETTARARTAESKH
jgi:hypothetical protein